MSATMIRCPNCGSTDVHSTAPDQYKCLRCGGGFNLIRPDVMRQDVVSHNCPVCGKPVEAGKGFRCTRCGSYDLCPDCVSYLNPDGHVCKTCLKKAGQNCFICGKFAFQTCQSCVGLAAKGKKDPEVVTKVCGDCYNLWFIDHIELKKASGGMPPRWGPVTFHCPRCGQICTDCAEEKQRFLRGKTYVCKNCGSELTLREQPMDYLQES